MADNPVIVLWLPDSVRVAAEAEPSLRKELRQGLTRLWGKSDAEGELWDKGWLAASRNGVDGWAYVVTHSQVENRINDNFNGWRARVRQMGGELWKDIAIWTDTGLVETVGEQP